MEPEKLPLGVEVIGLEAEEGIGSANNGDRNVAMSEKSSITNSSYRPNSSIFQSFRLDQKPETSQLM